LAAHDWGGVALALGARLERVVALDVVPLLPGLAWHRIARAWQTPVVGELAMGFTGRLTLRRAGGLDAAHADAVLEHFDHGTQRAILKLYRSTRQDPPAGLETALAGVQAPALVVWGERDPFLAPAWADRIADALGGDASTSVVAGAGHWPWRDAPDVMQVVIRALTEEI
jgi:pimeloyl-ACP methyl ester carboxylesterase